MPQVDGFSVRGNENRDGVAYCLVNGVWGGLRVDGTAGVGAGSSERDEDTRGRQFSLEAFLGA